MSHTRSVKFASSLRPTESTDESAMLGYGGPYSAEYFGTPDDQLDAKFPPNFVYPCTIVPSRYNGVYEQGACWLAFPLYPNALPSGAFASDNECEIWWSEPRLVGLGDDPAQALADLVRRLATE